MNDLVARLFTVFVVLVVLGLGILVGVLPGGGGQSGRRTFSIDGEGRLPAYLLLHELGWPAERWRDAPGRLPAGDHLLFLPDAPPPPPGYGGSDDASPAGRDPDAAAFDASAPRRSSRQRDPLQYLRFLEEGGTVVSGFDDARRAFFVETLFLSDLEGIELVDAFDTTRAPVPALLRTGEALELAANFDRRFDVASLSPEFEILVADDQDRALAVQLDVGRGKLVLLSQDRFLGRDGIGARDDAVLLVRLVEEIAPAGRILFDDYALGDWTPDTPFQLALAPGRLTLTLHVLSFLLLGAWMVGWGFAFPRDPQPWRLLSPLARVRGYAAVLEREGRWDLAARLLRDGVLRRLGGGGERARASGLFLDREVRSKEDLERLGRELADLEIAAVPDAATKRTRHPWKKPRKS